MDDVSVVEVCHEHQADCGEYEAGQLPVEAPLLEVVELGPDEPVDHQRQEEGHVRGGQVQQETLLVDG